MTLAIAVAAGVLIGVSLGALGGGGSILAVPVLIYLLGQNPAQAMTGSLVVVGVTALIGAVPAHRAGHVLPWRGVTFGLVATGGAVAGAQVSAQVPQPVLLACFSVLLLAVGAFMAVREIRARRTNGSVGHERRIGGDALDDPIITVSPTFTCRCIRAVAVLITATVVGLLMGFFGVGGGFLVVPALTLALAMPIADAAGTSLVVIAVTSMAALAARQAAGLSFDWNVVLVLTTAAAVGGVVGTMLADRVAPHRLRQALTTVVVGAGVYTSAQALPALA